MAQPSQHHTKPSFVGLPTEILSKIIESVDIRSDLLSLALANRMLSNLILPHHMDLFQIQCYHRDPRGKLWQFMLQTPIRCQRVKILSFIDSPEQAVLPRELADYAGGEGADEGQSSVVLPYEALSKMRNLRCIHLDLCNVSEDYVVNIGDALRKSGCALEELGVTYTGGLPVLYPEPRIMEPYYPRLTLFSLDLSRLSTLCLTLSWLEESEFDFILNQLLRNSTNLSGLYICLSPSGQEADDFFLHMFEHCQWSKLKKLTVDIHTDSVQTLSGFNIFCQRHPTLTTLFITFPLIPGFFPSKSETRVTSLHTVCMRGSATDTLPDYIAQNLVHLSFDYVAESTFEGISLPSLRSCVLARVSSDYVLSGIVKFIQAAPNVQKCWVYVSKSSPPEDKERVIRNLVSSLRTMTSLTHLMGLFSEIDITKPYGIQLFQSLDELPSVVYADARIGEQAQFVQVTRYRSGSDYYKIIPPYSVDASLDHRTWGGW